MDIFTMIMACSLYPDNSTTNAIIQIGSGAKPLAVTSVSVDGVVTNKDTFKNAAQAAQYAQTAIDRGDEVAIGLMQLPYKWLPQYEGRTSLEELFRPCKNMVIATDALNKAARQCRIDDELEPSCALSVYRTGDLKRGIAYAEAVLKYAAEHPMKNRADNAVHHQQGLPPVPEIPEPDFGFPS
jgi:hypothetical protein